jgi:hypothetical protein
LGERLIPLSPTFPRGFVGPSSGTLDLNDLIPDGSGWVLERAEALNDRGQIVGTGTLDGQQGRAFLLRERHAPSTWRWLAARARE